MMASTQGLVLYAGMDAPVVIGFADVGRGKWVDLRPFGRWRLELTPVDGRPPVVLDTSIQPALMTVVAVQTHGGTVYGLRIDPQYIPEAYRGQYLGRLTGFSPEYDNGHPFADRWPVEIR